MTQRDEQAEVSRLISAVNEASSQSTGGRWLEEVTVEAARLIRDWDMAQCWPWADWPERETHFHGATAQDIGIDCVGIRGSGGDRQHVAIQCKSRQLDASGQGASITKAEIDSFANASSGAFWAERWIVTNGDNPLSQNAQSPLIQGDRPIKIFNISSDLQHQHQSYVTETCSHCQPDAPPDAKRTRSCMQDEAVETSVRILREHAQADTGGLPVGQARGKIILPCGTGKTRISLRIVEELTPPGGLAVVLCPSIALVAQLRREYLNHAAKPIRALAVCSDQTAGYDPKNEDKASGQDNPTADNSNVSASEVKGEVTTDAKEIAEWIRRSSEQGADSPVSVIFGTYQSSHRVAEALVASETTADVLIADESHRTAGLRRNKKLEERLRDFTICHNNDRFPAKYRIYQTATPRIYNTAKIDRDRPGDWVVRNMDDESVFGVELYRKSYPEAVANGWLADYRIIAMGVNDAEAYAAANELASATEQKGRKALTTTHFLKGLTLALVLGGATNTPDNADTSDNAGNAEAVAGPDSRLRGNDGLGRGNDGLDVGNDGLGDGSDGLRDGSDGLGDGNEGLGRGNDGLGVADSHEATVVKSCISFMNTVDKSKTMARQLESDKVRQWVQQWLDANRNGQPVADYSLEHLDASSNVTAREQAKVRLGQATEDKPHAIVNVGIFGEGTDAPSLSAVAFLEARKSPIDVIQAVGRAMRVSKGKEMGYIVCPILIPPNVDAEKWLMTSGPEDGWQELGQVLLALRAHDSRIEDNLADLIQIYIPTEPETETNIVAIAVEEDGQIKRIRHWAHTGKPGEAQKAVERVLEGRSKPSDVFYPLSALEAGPTAVQEARAKYKAAPDTTTGPIPEPAHIITGKNNSDGTSEIRIDIVAHGKPGPDGATGPVDYTKSKGKIKEMVNKGAGTRLAHSNTKTPKPTQKEVNERNAARMLRLTGLEDYGDAIMANLLQKSGLRQNRVMRDLNILEESVSEAARHLRDDGLQPTLNRHFMLDNLDEKAQKSMKDGKAADGCTIIALLMMNAAMLHQRIANGRWLNGVSDLETVKNDANVVHSILREWNSIMSYDFRPVLEPAVKAIGAVEDSRKLAGLERALRHIAAEAERIAEAYADMGADHAGPLFNEVMGNQASDGAFFTRPVAASIAARLTPRRLRRPKLGATAPSGKPTRRWTWPVAAAHCSRPF